VARRNRLGLDAGNIDIRIEDTDSRVDVVEFGDQMPKLKLVVLDLAREFSALSSEGVQDVRLIGIDRDDLIWHAENITRTGI
jgi:hypothetical protein